MALFFFLLCEIIKQMRDKKEKDKRSKTKNKKDFVRGGKGCNSMHLLYKEVHMPVSSGELFHVFGVSSIPLL